jgi:glycosyltransferase involved in cell wall biosynthesis
LTKWIVSQLGAREHYAVPRALHAEGQLERLYTDVWCRLSPRLLALGGAAGRSMAGRRHPELPADRVTSFERSALWARARGAWRRAAQSVEAQYEEHIRIGREFALAVNRDLERWHWEARAFFGYNTGSLETLEFLGSRGVTTVVDQIDPGRVEEEIVLREAGRWPGWEAVPGRRPDAFYDRLRREWDRADVVLVNSRWSREALVQQGVSPEKLLVVPLAYEPPAGAQARQSRQSEGPMTVLWLGSVILRKGIQYLIEAARQCQGHAVRFVVAGPVLISEAAVKSAPPNVTFVGRVSRTEAAEAYRKADVFVLPTLSDGFAITQLEAMAHGLPVITTPNCGDVVTDGIDGLIVPAADPQALAAAVVRLREDSDLRAAMSERAVATSRRFTLRSYYSRLTEGVEQRKTPSGIGSLPAAAAVLSNPAPPSRGR